MQREVRSSQLTKQSVDPFVTGEAEETLRPEVTPKDPNSLLEMVTSESESTLQNLLDGWTNELANLVITKVTQVEFYEDVVVSGSDPRE
jgi:hypothetical protein